VVSSAAFFSFLAEGYLILRFSLFYNALFITSFLLFFAPWYILGVPLVLRAQHEIALRYRNALI